MGPAVTARKPDGVSESLLVKAHPGLCEGWGNCHRWAPDVYPLDSEGIIDVHMLEVPPDRAVDAWNAAMACPAGVISIVDVVRREGAPVA
ncbi:MAG: ferredoxin [Microthrixaceae bacterium]